MIEAFGNKDRKRVAELYESQKHQYSFVHSVITGLQNGRIFVDDLSAPRAAFICHDFGWCQLIGSDAEFLNDIDAFVFRDEAFSSLKIRAFAPEPVHVGLFKDRSAESERCQFRLHSFGGRTSVPVGFQIAAIDSTNSRQVSETFGLDLFSRNWPSEPSFHRNSFGFVVYRDDVPCSVCYSCASMNGIEEIDVFSEPAFRGHGLAKLACSAFIEECFRRKLTPTWDCFTNNEGSMALARSLGFEVHGGPYPFFTYNRGRKA